MNSLEQRFLEFSKDVVKFCKSIRFDPISRPLVTQLVRSATSIGANYSESQSGIRAKVSISKKEAQETKYWLAVLDATIPERRGDITILAQEADQICRILQAILNKTKP